MFMVGNCASAFLSNLGTDFSYMGISHFHLLIATRIFVSLGGGVMASSATAAAASAPHPERIFAIALITYSLFSSLESPLLPMAFIPYGAAGGFLFMAGSALLLLPFSFWLLPPKVIEKAEKEGVWLSLKSAPNRKLALTAMAALLIFEVGQGGVDKLTGLIGEETGLDETAVGWAFFWGSNVGLLGGLLTTWLGDRYGYARPLALGIIMNVVPGVWFMFCDTGTEFAITYTVWSAAYYFVTPYFFAAMARLDNLGRWAVAMEAAWTGGDVIAAWAAGELLEYAGFLSIGGLVLVTGIIALVILMDVGRRLDAKEEASGGRAA
jgi:predicted MFS family arabinose efflux permease